MYFACCSEIDCTNFEEFNSGVMLLNVENMLNTYNMFIDTIDKNHYDYASYDQGALQSYYKNKVDKLSLLLNHKPYWGKKDDALILHYHGPKPRDIVNYINGNVSSNVIYNWLFTMTTEKVWKYYLFVFTSLK